MRSHQPGGSISKRKKGQFPAAISIGVVVARLLALAEANADLGFGIIFSPRCWSSALSQGYFCLPGRGTFMRLGGRKWS